MILKTIKCLTFAVVALVSENTMAQDLIARQAPIDRKMHAIDSVALQRQIRLEQGSNPSYNLYPSWSNEFVHSYGDVSVPDSFRINMRGYAMPTNSRVITSNFGARWGRQHKGIDIKVYIGDTICAAFDGKVRIVKYEHRGYGNYVVIRHPNGLETVYGHLSRQLVHENQTVRAGEPIGLGGNTGRSTGSHLHFETRLLGQAINPALLFDFERQDATCDYYEYRSRGNGTAVGFNGRGNNVSRTYASLASSSFSDRFKRNTPENGKSAKGSVRYHKVHKGETLTTIAQKNGLTVDRLCKLNRITRKSKVRPGQVLKCS